MCWVRLRGRLGAHMIVGFVYTSLALVARLVTMWRAFGLYVRAVSSA